MSGEGGGGDPWDLDPFGDEPYNPTLAFAATALKDTRERIDIATEAWYKALSANPDSVSIVAVSARKSADVQMSALRVDLLEEIERLVEKAQDSVGTDEEVTAANEAISLSNLAVWAIKEVLFTIGVIEQSDEVPQVPVSAPISLVDPSVASEKIGAPLRKWVAQQRDSGDGNIVIVETTPGVGKTHQMMDVMVAEQAGGQRNVFAVWTKSMIRGDNPEITNRIAAAKKFGKLHLAVITGRDEDNCYEWGTVESVMSHGYTPGQAVCFHCDHYPDNAYQAGVGICEYYGSRISAHSLTQGARVGMHKEYPIVITTHSSLVAAFQSGGGRFGSFWGADNIFIDEDPTAAIEIDISLSEEQSGYRSADPEKLYPHNIAMVFSEAVEIAKKERQKSIESSFCAVGSDEMNTHSIHSRVDSVYSADSLFRLLSRSVNSLQQTDAIPHIERALAEVAESDVFEVDSGSLANVRSVADLNAMDVPPRPLKVIASAIRDELSHAAKLRTDAFFAIRGHGVDGLQHDEIVRQIENETELDPLSYHVRLECSPIDVDEGRLEDEWRFVVRTQNDFLNSSSAIIVGDAYAERGHYEQIFRRPVEVISVISELHPDTKIIRVQHDECRIGRLKRGSLNPLLGMVESWMPAGVEGARVLFYVHKSLIEDVRQWAEGVKKRRGIAEIAIEHWWGGRGKDAYNSWEYTFLLSEPTQNLNAMKHTVNARAFQNSTRTKDPEERLKHGRQIELGGIKNGVMRAFGGRHPMLQMEHERQNVAEQTQALHRSRPVHNGVMVVIFGEMELGRDLIAQTINVIPKGSRKDTSSSVQRKRAARLTGSIDSFTNHYEGLNCIRAIIAHYGIFSPYFFAHSLQTTALEMLNDSDPNRIAGAVYSLYNLKTGPAIRRSAVTNQLGEFDALGRSEPVLEHSGRDENAQVQILRTVIERVFDPPEFWRLRAPKDVWPTGTIRAVAELDKCIAEGDPNLAKATAGRWASWEPGKRGRKPDFYFDPETASEFDATELFYEIIDKQYGRSAGGKLNRPNAAKEVPRIPWNEIPF